MSDPSSSAPEVRAAARAARSALERVTNRRGRVGVLGSLNADLTVTTRTLPGPGETVVGDPLVVRPGGKSANQAVACALAGADTLMVGAVGDDAHGEMLRESLTRAGVDISGVRSAQVATGTAVITVDHRGENTIVVSAGANGTLGADDVHDAADALRAVSVLGLCLEVSDPALLAAQRLVNSAGGTTVLNVSPLREVSAELVADAQVLIVNEHELRGGGRLRSGPGAGRYRGSAGRPWHRPGRRHAGGAGFGGRGGRTGGERACLPRAGHRHHRCR